MTDPTTTFEGRIRRTLNEYAAQPVPAGLEDRLVARAMARPARDRLRVIVGGSLVFAAAAAVAAIAVAVHLSETRLSAQLPSSHPPAVSSIEPSPTAGWKAVSDAAGRFSFRVPAAWEVNGPCVRQPQSFPGYPTNEVRTGPPVAFPSVCGSDSASNIIVDSGVPAAFPAPPADSCETVTATQVTIAGVPGTRTVRSSSCAGSASLITYSFETNGLRYEITDQRNPAGAASSNSPADPDLTTTLDMIMKDTWAFHG
jgi:hypothetical protein